MPLSLSLMLALPSLLPFPTSAARPRPAAVFAALRDEARQACTPTAPVDEIRKVVAAITAAAEENAKTRAVEGDALADLYLRRAAAAARAERVSPEALLIGLGIALDDTEVLHGNPALKVYLHQIESTAERRRRIKILGEPTLRGRHDWLLHFAVSAALTAQLGPEAAQRAGILKELWDAQTTSGFSFADLAADYAGIAVATALLKEGKDGPCLRTLAEKFQGTDYLPTVDDLEDGMPWDRFQEKYGHAPTLKRRCDMIRARVADAPGWKKK